MYAHQSQYSISSKKKIHITTKSFIFEYSVHVIQAERNTPKTKLDYLNRNLANVEWSKSMFPPEAEKVQGKPKGYTNEM